MTRVAGIDIGTNTILMLVAEVDSAGAITVLRDEHAIGRLGKGVDKEGLIQPETFARTLGILDGLKRTAEALHVDCIAACGTSALRDAANRQEYIDLVRTKLGIGIRVLTGDEEAALTYAGTVQGRATAGDRRYGVLDIGGGSTEVILGTNDSLASKGSMDIGCVRLTERILKASPPAPESLEQARMLTRGSLEKLPRDRETRTWFGVAGTVTTLAALDLQLPVYDGKRVEGHVLSKSRIEQMFMELRLKTLDQLRAVPQIHPLRADILLAGIIILLEAMEYYGLKEILATDRGLRYGIVFGAAESFRRTQAS